MSKKILAICLAVIGFGGLLSSGASAHEAGVPVPIHSSVGSLPSTVRINRTVVIEGRHRRNYRHYRHHYGYGRGYRRYHGYRHHRYNNGRRYHHRTGVSVDLR